MKKWTVLLVLACLAIFSQVVFATPTETVPTDGQIIDELPMITVDPNYPSAAGPRYFSPDEPWAPQTAKVRLPLNAVLPCHLEFKFEGNDLAVLLENWGPGMNTEYAPSNIYIAFQPKVGGYLRNWDLIAGSFSMNYEVEPSDTTFIRACDTFRSTIWSNMNYQYSVKSAGLTGGVLGQNLPVDMRAAVILDPATIPGVAEGDAANWPVKHTFTSASADKLVANGDATHTTVVLQQFRVPYDRIYAGGKYTGAMEFAVATI